MTSPVPGGRREPPSSTGQPSATSTRAHLLDAIFFRGLAVWLLTELIDRASTIELLAAFFGLFFMPDALRGRESLAADVIRRVLGRADT